MRKTQRIVLSKKAALTTDQLKLVTGGGIGTSPSDPIKKPEEVDLVTPPQGIGTSPS